MTQTPDLKTTPLHDVHTALGARMASFAGYAMPIQYTGIVAEHEAVRQNVGMFDTCHMGELRISGPTATTDLEALLTRPVASIRHGHCRYSLMCNEQGGVIDDLLVYRFSEHDYMLVINASGQVRDTDWIRAHLSPTTLCRDVSRETGKIDVQGPGAPRVVASFFPDAVRCLGFYQFTECAWRGLPVVVSRTGYTGEIGYEIYAPSDRIADLWEACITAGALPAGLGARDTLRLEMGMPLYGHELTEDRNANQTGFTHVFATDKSYCGSDAIAEAPQQRLVGIRLDGRQSARAGDPVLGPDGSPAGTVTSGSYAPSLGTAVALAYVAPARVEPAAGGEALIETARKRLKGTFCAPPFYDRGTARDNVSTHLKEETR
jgi:aminomethyltransferase